MRQLGTEEKAALLLASADEDDNDSSESPIQIQKDNFPTVSKRPKTYQRRRTESTHPVLCFMLVLGAFVFGCLSGALIMLYRMSQDAERASFSSSSDLIKVDLSIKTKLSQSITKTNFLNFNRTIESENESANKLEQTWQSYSKIFTRVNKLSYDVTLSTYSPSTQWSGIQLLSENTDQELAKFDLLSTNDYLTFSSLIKSGKITANYIYYVNYGRQEDFAYLFKQNQIQSENNDKTILFMRRKSSIISQTEQIRHAIHYGFAGLVLFDDNEQISTTTITNDRQSFSDEWKRLSTEKERQKFLDGISNDDDEHQISVLILSYSNVENIFSSIPSDSNKWLPCPTQWHDKSTSLKLGGMLKQTKIRLTTFMQEVPVHLPVVLGYIRGTVDPEHFLMVGYQLGRKQQEKILNEIIQVYGNQMKNNWNPKRSIIFCAWSGLSYDRYTIRHWLSENYRLVDRNLIGYIDLGNGVMGNSTLNLHGSPLFQQIAENAADFVVSPLVHDHSCHHRQKQTTMSPEHIHHHRRRRHGDDHGSQHEEMSECEPHKLLDEWMRASNNRIGVNKSIGIVQMIDTDSSAALFQLQHGIPSLLIEMTEEQAITNDTFYLKKSPAVFTNEIKPEVIVAYTQFVSEMIRQLIDEPLLPFNLTNYANLIDKQTTDYFLHYNKQYNSLNSHLGDSNEMTKIINDLTKSIRQVQSVIDQTPQNKYDQMKFFNLNEKLIEFERLFINDDQTYKSVFIGPAFGLTNTVVPFPLLSNLLYNFTSDTQTELTDASKLYWSKTKQHIQLITRTLNGFDGLLSNA